MLENSRRESKDADEFFHLLGDSEFGGVKLPVNIDTSFPCTLCDRL